MSSLEWIRATYGVPAKRGMRIRVQGKEGTINMWRDGYLMVRFDGDNRTKPVHPKWNITYLDENGNVLWEDREKYT